jgi:hypothetical protein
MARIGLRFEDGQEFVVQLRPVSTPTVAKLLEELPFRSISHRWGDEAYFEAPFHSPLEEDARADMELGEVAYWPDGNAIAVFFGPTPISKHCRPMAYSPCNVLGRVQGEIEGLKRLKNGTKVEVHSP